MKTTLALLLLAVLVSCGGSNSQSGRSNRRAQYNQQLQNFNNIPGQVPGGVYYPTNTPQMGGHLQFGCYFGQGCGLFLNGKKVGADRKAAKNDNTSASNTFILCFSSSVKSVKFVNDNARSGTDFDREVKEDGVMTVAGNRIYAKNDSVGLASHNYIKKACKKKYVLKLVDLPKLAQKGTSNIIITTKHSNGSEHVNRLTIKK